MRSSLAAGRIFLRAARGFERVHFVALSTFTFTGFLGMTLFQSTAMGLTSLESFDAGLFYCLFDTPDRIQHMFWRYGEPDHPAHRGKPPDPEFTGVIKECYLHCDAVVGKALEATDDKTLLLHDWERFACVLAPKVSGAWNLHALTRDLPQMFQFLAKIGATGFAS